MTGLEPDQAGFNVTGGVWKIGGAAHVFLITS